MQTLVVRRSGCYCSRMKRLVVALAVLAAGSLRGDPAPEVAAGYRPVIQVTPLLKTMTTSAGQPIVYPKVDDAQVTAVRVVIPPGAETGWHRHPFPCYGYILSGNLVVEMEGGKVEKLSAGQALAESVDVLHNGRNVGTEPVTLVMFVTGEKDKPFTVKAEPPAGAN